jgi:hypothetical protein
MDLRSLCKWLWWFLPYRRWSLRHHSHLKSCSMLLCLLVSLSRQCLLISREVAMPTLSMERGNLNPASWFCCWNTRLQNEVGSGHHSAQSIIKLMVWFDGLRSLTFQPQLIWSNYSWMGWEIGPEWPAAASAPSKKSRSGISWMGWNCTPGVKWLWWFLPCRRWSLRHHSHLKSCWMLLCLLVSLSRQCLLISREVAMPTLSMERGKLNPASWFCCWSTWLQNEVGNGHHSAQSTIKLMVRFDGLSSLIFQPHVIWSDYSVNGLRNWAWVTKHPPVHHPKNLF